MHVRLDGCGGHDEDTATTALVTLTHVRKKLRPLRGLNGFLAVGTPKVRKDIGLNKGLRRP